MKIPAFVPADLRTLLRFVPARGWDAIDWAPLLSSLQTLSVRFVTGRGVAGLRRQLAAKTPEIQLVSLLHRVERLPKLVDPERRQAAGDAILQLYFRQWLSAEGLFIDLRPDRFGLDENNTLHFAPNGLWLRLRPEFRNGMANLYRAFYGDDEAALDDALAQLGMLRDDLPDSARRELKQLLRAHFGHIEDSNQRFAIDPFKASFDELFDFFLRHDYRLHADFVIVGFYLITLYLTLEQTGQPHDVRRICTEALSG